MKYSKKYLSVSSIILMGFISLVTQSLVIREILVRFQGNELTIGIILTNWLIFESIGAYLTGYFIKKKNIIKIAIFLQLIIIAALLWSYYFISKFKIIFDISFGQTIGLIPTLFIPTIALFFLCIPLGFQFSLSSKLIHKFLKNKKSNYSISFTYFLEAIGWFLGGILFSFIFVYFLNDFHILLVILAISLINLLIYLNISSRNILRDVIIITFTIFIILSLLHFDSNIIKNLNKFNSKYNLVEVDSSIYGKIHVNKYKNQVNIYQNGILTYSSDNILKNEESVHLSLLHNPKIKKVALIGGGLTNGINEILKYPNIKKIYYCEIDPKIIELCKKYYNYPYYNSRKIEIINKDGRYFIKNIKKNSLDAVIINLPDPSTAQLNRYYSLDFFTEVKNVLKKKGLFSISLSSSESYISSSVKSFNASIVNSLKKVYTGLDIIPGNSVILIGYKNYSPNINKKNLINNLKFLKKKNRYINEYYLKYRLDHQKLEYFKSIIDNNKNTILNTDFHPITYYLFLSRWSSIFNTDSTKVFNYLKETINPFNLIIFFTILFILKYILKKHIFTNIDLFSISFYIGFSGMALQLIIIYLFQAFHGYLYSQIAIITACYMAGMALGSYLLNLKNKKDIFFQNYLRKSLFILMIIIFSMPFILKSIDNFKFIKSIIFHSFALLNGFFTGSIFASLNKTWLKNRSKFSFVESGTFYSLDLLGGACSALISSVIFIPLLGLKFYCLILGFIIFLNILLFKL